MPPCDERVRRCQPALEGRTRRRKQRLGEKNCIYIYIYIYTPTQSGGTASTASAHCTCHSVAGELLAPTHSASTPTLRSRGTANQHSHFPVAFSPMGSLRESEERATREEVGGGSIPSALSLVDELRYRSGAERNREQSDGLGLGNRTIFSFAPGMPTAGDTLSEQPTQRPLGFPCTLCPRLGAERNNSNIWFRSAPRCTNPPTHG